jgi:hypothetical protein
VGRSGARFLVHALLSFGLFHGVGEAKLTDSLITPAYFDMPAREAGRLTAMLVVLPEAIALPTVCLGARWSR